MINDEILNEFLNIQDSCDQDFLAKIDSTRDRILSYDKSIVNNITDMDDALVHSGRFTITIDNTEFQCLFCNGSSNCLVVSYNGARPQKSFLKDPDYNTPIFPRWSYYPLNDGCFLSIDDPMFKLYPDLSLGWYYGDHESCFIHSTLKIVKLVCDKKSIDVKNVTFFSSSGGGYAALFAACSFPYSLSISINPQIYIQNFPYASNFQDITSIDLSAYDNLHRNDLFYKLTFESKSKHLILVNVTCSHDYLNQLKPLADKYGVTLRYGLNHINNVLIWLYEACGAPHAHTSFETKYIYVAIDHIANQFKVNPTFDAEFFQKFVIFLNECWRDIYSYKKLSLLKDNIISKDIIFLNNGVLDIKSGSCIYNNSIDISKNHRRYNHISFDLLESNSLFEIVICGVSPSIDRFSLGFYDCSVNDMIKLFEIKINDSSEHTLCFITGENIKNVVLCIYAGLAGITQNKELHIQSLKIYKKLIKEL